jgi:hypothetical protein
MADRDLLPVRYGTRLPDETAITRTLEERHDEFEAALSRVRGAVEVSLRVVFIDGPTSSSDRPAEAPDDDGASIGEGQGARYLRARGQASAERESVAEAVDRPLAALARAAIRIRPHTPLELLHSAYLVDRRRLAVFTRAVAKLQDANPDLGLLCTGPWPPYSFVGQ